MNSSLAIAALASLALTGCALAPTNASVEVQHVSHTLQHFGPNPTDYGFQEADVNAHWDLPHHWYADASEGVAFGGCSRGFSAGRETFTGRVGYTFWEKP